MSHLPLVIVEARAWLGWKLLGAADRLHRFAVRLDDGIPEDPAANATAIYLEYQALKAPEVVKPGPRIQRYMTQGEQTNA